MKAVIRLGSGSLFACLVALLVSSGCASRESAEKAALKDHERQALANAPARVRLKNFGRAELRSVSFTGDTKQRDTDELARRIDLVLQMELAPLWPKVTLVPRDVAFQPTAPGTLQIEPVIMESKLVSPLDRELFTWAMGDSYVVIKVLFKDGATGEPVAEPKFFRRADRFWASWGGGFDDAEIERQVARDICLYARDNL